MRKLFIITALVAGTAQAGTVVTNSGTYAVSQSGSTTYVTQAGRGNGSGSSPVVVAPSNSSLPSSVVTNSGTYVVVPNYSTGGTMAVIQTSKGKK